MNNVNQPAFRPTPAGTVAITAGTASSCVQLQSDQLARHVRVFNAGSVTVFLEFGASNGVAAKTAGSLPLAAGAAAIFTAPYEFMAAIVATSSSLVYATPGEGVS